MADASKFSQFIASKKIDSRRILVASHALETLQLEDRRIKLAKRGGKKEGADAEAKKETRKPRSGRPVTPRALQAALTGGNPQRPHQVAHSARREPPPRAEEAGEGRPQSAVLSANWGSSRRPPLRVTVSRQSETLSVGAFPRFAVAAVEKWAERRLGAQPRGHARSCRRGRRRARGVGLRRAGAAAHAAALA